MTPKEAFKIGFLEKCAKDGLSEDETLLRIRQAKFMLKSGIARGAWDTLRSMFGAAWPLALLAPPLVGVGGGAMLAKAQNDTFDKNEAYKREEISEYQRAVEQLQRLQARQQAGMGAG